MVMATRDLAEHRKLRPRRRRKGRPAPKPPVYTRADRVHAESWREFQVHRDAMLALYGQPWERAREVPPWHEKLIDGSLGPEYGPRTEGEYMRVMHAYRDSIYGGGLWDPEEEDRMHPERRVRKEKAQVERYDGVAMQRYVQRHGHTLPSRELEAYFRFYRDGMSYRRMAGEMAVQLSTARELIRRLRQRLNGN